MFPKLYVGADHWSSNGQNDQLSNISVDSIDKSSDNRYDKTESPYDKTNSLTTTTRQFEIRKSREALTTVLNMFKTVGRGIRTFRLFPKSRLTPYDKTNSSELLADSKFGWKS